MTQEIYARCVDCDKSVTLTDKLKCSICGSNSVIVPGAVKELEMALAEKVVVEDPPLDDVAVLALSVSKLSREIRHLRKEIIALKDKLETALNK